jgi:hypothetical protein
MEPHTAGGVGRLGRRVAPLFACVTNMRLTRAGTEIPLPPGTITGVAGREALFAASSRRAGVRNILLADWPPC